MRIAYYLPIGLEEYRSLTIAEAEEVRLELNELIDERNAMAEQPPSMGE